ncbi:hypothetical protein DI09_344p10 [Mitosporidium daphniae]|uniref:Uncharacterized protein n=1 Tax=Mitosporidium daphniae TaxID=1485682 RepID=A0A098VR30_9MICR|nr:uncharacterized protein DI09_344p10 [Mitosporidium daphniae]KGG51482.1 hypothetical protein DI09_344p10 [Mitosporidium daphniae]|eukprot:XP_013237918.1 uncharacterized protein DI09_344p10 [Mitosporidium daphniae]
MPLLLSAFKNGSAVVSGKFINNCNDLDHIYDVKLLDDLSSVRNNLLEIGESLEIIYPQNPGTYT